MRLHRIRLIWAAAASLLACVPAAGRAEAQAAWRLGGAAEPPPGAAAYLRRPELPARLDVPRAVKFIDDGVRYVDPWSEFFVSPAGELCFRTLPYPPANVYVRHDLWCAYPQTIGRVEAIRNDITNINAVRLWCMRAYPQCARRVALAIPMDNRNWFGNSITAQTLTYRQEQSAIQDLIYLMAGNRPASEPIGMSAEEGLR
jgi:hypothetical protein